MTSTQTPECREILYNISAYLDGELDADVCDIVERHCQGCASCAALVDGLRETVGLCRQAAGVELPAAVRERARAAVRQLLDASPPDGSR